MTAFPSKRRGVLAGLALVASSLGGCDHAPAPGNGAQGQTPGNDQRAEAPSPCGGYAPVLASSFPSRPAIDQPGLDCEAWQIFIALNWRADPNKPGFPDPTADAASFGTPGDLDPKVWETYLEAATVFGGTGAQKGLWQAKRPGIKTLTRTSKFGALDLSDITQAGGDHFLTNQRGDVTYFEVMMNQDEYEFITSQEFDLTTAAGQLQCATQKGVNGRGGLSMPSGAGDGWHDTDCKGVKQVYGQDVGSMEIKAAWTPLPADHSLDYRYKISTAQIQDPATGTMRTVTVGLVGMHIIHKSPERQQWTWATFEQIDNSPDATATGFAPPALPANANLKPSPGFTFFNPACDPAKDPAYGCKTNSPPTPCAPGVKQCQPYDAPMQITRVTPVGEPANSATGYAWGLLPAGSVFNYYRLINVQWRQRPTILPPGQRLPAPFDGFVPPDTGPNGNQIVANTTLESFQQTSNSCLDCHAQYASIATAPSLQATGGVGGRLRKLARRTQDGPPAYASDYSFIFITETKR